MTCVLVDTMDYLLILISLKNHIFLFALLKLYIILFAWYKYPLLNSHDGIVRRIFSYCFIQSKL